MSLSQRLIRSSAFNFADHLLKVVAMFVLTPAMVDGLGEYNYGIWLLVMAFVSYYTFLDLGMTLASVRFLARAIGQKRDVADTIASCRSMFGRISLLSMALTGLGILFCGAFLSNPETAASVRWMILIFGVGIALRFRMMVYQVVLKANVLYGAIGASSAGRTIVQTSLCLWALSSGYGIVALAAILGICDVGQQLFLWACASRVLAQQGTAQGEARLELRRKMLTYSMGSFATRLGINLKDRIDPFVVAGVAGASLVPVFSIGTRFLVVARDFANALFGGQFLAAFSTVDASAGRERLRADFLTALKLSSAIAVFFCAGIAMLGPVFIEAWVGPAFAQSADVLLLLVGPYCLFMIQYPGLGLLFSIDAHRSLAKIVWAGSALNLVLSIALGLQFGLIGVVWATVVDLVLVYGLLFPVVLTKAAGIPLGAYLRAIAVGAVIVAIPAAVYYSLVRKFIEADFLSIVMVGSGLGIVFLAGLWFGGFVRLPEGNRRGSR